MRGIKLPIVGRKREASDGDGEVEELIDGDERIEAFRKGLFATMNMKLNEFRGQEREYVTLSETTDIGTEVEQSGREQGEELIRDQFGTRHHPREHQLFIPRSANQVETSQTKAYRFNQMREPVVAKRE